MKKKEIIKKIAIGFITYDKSTAKYLPYFLPSLTVDYADDFKILCFDNSEDEDNENIKYIRENYPNIEIMRAGENLGFAKAYNRMIKRAKELGAEYFLALNPDMILESGAIGKMVEALDKDQGLGSVCPKILRWDFTDNKKTNIIDSCGIKQLSGLNFYDLGQAEKDMGQCDNQEIIGPSGAAAMYRMSALEKVREGENYFDELMFMYEEDCDLAYRLKIAGFKSQCVKGAIIYHDRTAEAKGQSNIKIALNRKNKPRRIKRLGFLHKHIIFIKYWNLQNFKEKLEVLWYGFKMFIFALIFEQYLLREYLSLWHIRYKIKKYKF
jgi:GT2 family glycosyltransferase